MLSACVSDQVVSINSNAFIGPMPRNGNADLHVLSTPSNKLQITLDWGGPVSKGVGARDRGDYNVPSQFVTVAFHSFTSCSLVPLKCSTNASPKT